jgi:hypothetical protein
MSADTSELRRITTVQRRPSRRSAPPAELLGSAYWRAVRSASAGLVRVRAGTAGVELTLLGGPTLLALGPVVATQSEGASAYRREIVGGALTGAARGALELHATADEVSVAVTGFVPRWGALSYALVQRPFHVWVSRRFFSILERAA